MRKGIPKNLTEVFRYALRNGLTLAVGMLAVLGIGGCSCRGDALIASGAAAEIAAVASLVDVAEDAAQALPDMASGVAQPTLLQASVPMSKAEQVMEALAAAYPDRIGSAEFRDGDWAVPVYGEWFYYAEGRLLPEKLRANFADYSPQPFYQYSEDLPEWKTPDAEAAERMKNAAAQRQDHPVKRSQYFYDAIWRSSTKEDAYLHIKSTHFLGWTVLVHYSILEELALLEEAINAKAKTDAQVTQWIANISSLSGWNWRGIADIESRSFHAYGAAVDIVLKAQRGKETYWLWSAQNKQDWWAIPYDKRVHPPEAVVKIFESYGFVWGGKWLFYDTMHFEYRPEIFILNHIPMNGGR